MMADRAEVHATAGEALLAFVAAIGENKGVAMANAQRSFEAPFTDVPGAVAEIRAGGWWWWWMTRIARMRAI